MAVLFCSPAAWGLSAEKNQIQCVWHTWFMCCCGFSPGTCLYPCCTCSYQRQKRYQQHMNLGKYSLLKFFFAVETIQMQSRGRFAFYEFGAEKDQIHLLLSGLLLAFLLLQVLVLTAAFWKILACAFCPETIKKQEKKPKLFALSWGFQASAKSWDKNCSSFLFLRTTL